jgi:hypothetical protein
VLVAHSLNHLNAHLQPTQQDERTMLGRTYVQATCTHASISCASRVQQLCTVSMNPSHPITQTPLPHEIGPISTLLRPQLSPC